MATIKRIRTMKGAGVLANRSAKDQGSSFRRFNLIYGFNGSGKSTLSRIFACLQAGKQHDELPANCTFEIEMDDGTIYSAPKVLQGVENRVCVFNTDFITQNLRWKEGKANSIFYISQEQAELAAKLKTVETSLPTRLEAKVAEAKITREREKNFNTYRTERARFISSLLHSGNRRYEAGQLKNDYENLPFDASSIISAEALGSLEDITRLSAPPPPIPTIAVDTQAMQSRIESARQFGDLSVGEFILEELEKHPAMVPWIKTGYDYHIKHALETCLLCGSELTQPRKAMLAAALDDKISKLLADLNIAQLQTSEVAEAAATTPKSLPKKAELDLTLQVAYELAVNTLDKSFGEAYKILKEALKIVEARMAQPTTKVSHSLPSQEHVAAICDALQSAVDLANKVIGQHNTATADFTKRQDDARVSIRQHYLAEGQAAYTAAKDAVTAAEASVVKIEAEISTLNSTIADLRAQVRAHGPAAEKITKLIHSYLGHGELTIFAADEGYEPHRYGKIVKGPPSEGEKTAIALCYFLSTLEADGRAIKDLIVVVDDPISSLDTKAMNYACVLVRSRLIDASQVFILTHNQYCMNEFKKAWRAVAYPKNAGTAATGTFLYLDVAIPQGSTARSASLVEMSPLLREYDSEYHFLCQKVLEFEAAGEGHSDYGFMMPNVKRRVLEVFLAFKVPGSSPIKDKLARLCKEHPEIDATRITALERLSQVESHSDNLDDLIGHSSMTIEEARDANAALLALMNVADKNHTIAIRKQCKAAT